MVVGVGAVLEFLCDSNVGIVEYVVLDFVVGTVVTSSVSWVPATYFECSKWCIIWLWVGFDGSSG